MKNNRLRFILIGVSIVLAALHAYGSRYRMNPDGIGYLDLGAAFTRGDWANAISSYWSPVYPCILGFVVRLSHSEGLGQFAVAHLLNFLIFLLDIYIFDRFWTVVLSVFPELPETRSLRNIGFFIGYVVFLLTFIPMLELVTPDLLLTAVVLTVGLLLWTHLRSPKARWLILIGVLLGFGYLTKAIMFPVGLATLFTVGVCHLVRRRPVRPVLWAILAMLLVSSPLISVLSMRAGHFSTGDTGRLAYAWYISNDPHAHGELLYPLGALVDTKPTIYKVEAKPYITFWPAFNPPALSTNVHLRMNLRRQASVLKESFKAFRNQLLVENPFLLMAILILLAANLRALRAVPLTEYLPLGVFIFSALAAYALILVEPRYINSFGCLLMGVLLSLGLKNLGENDYVNARAILVVTAFLITLQAFPSFVSYSLDAVRRPETIATRIDADGNKEQNPLDQSKIAKALRDNGLIAGERVAIIGSPYTNYWVKLSGASVSGYIPAADARYFCGPGKGPSEDAFQVLNSTGSRWLVTSVLTTDCPGWQRAPGTQYQFRKLGQ